ncbi:type I 3-dehydroquinate dehydratase [Propionivibrio sp.]|uniref:type I 3-dehydroquinate dehydratase n=1 Tax=Propionivibrio sp. TaxID=2212460 RepID=UPI00272E2BE8|nr:type I 3-dehydroquinate dehydratase [Propionivibrio sp.]
MKRIQVGGKAIGRSGQPLICTPVIGRSRAAVLDELAALLPKAPDLIEWRVDFFEGFGDIAAVIDMAREIKAAAGTIPVVFACRAMGEGGGFSALNESDVVKLYVAACVSRCIDIIDYEMSNSPVNVAMLREVSRENGVAMIMSYHNHEFTPSDEELSGRFIEAEVLGADIAKVVVMPKGEEDVLALLSATLKASRVCGIPLVSMSMGGLGTVARVFGWVFGSSMTFGFGKHCSAPGQMSIEELRPVLASVQHAVYGG